MFMIVIRREGKAGVGVRWRGRVRIVCIGIMFDCYTPFFDSRMRDSLTIEAANL